LSLHKFGSNVVEKCLQFAPEDKRSEILNRFVAMPMVGIGKDVTTLADLMDSKFGNYVVQRVYNMSTAPGKSILISKIKEMGQSGLISLQAGSKAIHVINSLQSQGVKFDFDEANTPN
jgi:hypothetical protein